MVQYILPNATRFLQLPFAQTGVFVRLTARDEETEVVLPILLISGEKLKNSSPLIRHVMLSPDFYTLNAHTEFPFPHNNCDHITDQELFSLLFGDYHLPEFLTKYYVCRLGSDAVGSVADIVALLRRDADFVLAATCYLRLKFVLEALHVQSLMKRLRDVPLRIAAMRGDWFKTGVADDRVWRIDCLATWLFNYMIRSVESHCAGTVVALLEEPMRTGLRGMNTAIQSVRAEPCDGRYMWQHTAPYELVIYPFLCLVKGLWNAVAPIVTTDFASLGGTDCSTVTGWSLNSPNKCTADPLT